MLAPPFLISDMVMAQDSSETKKVAPSACQRGSGASSGRSVADISRMRRLTIAVATTIEASGRLPGDHMSRTTNWLDPA